MTELILKIDGMMCGACEAHVADAVRRAAKVKSVKASRVSGTVDAVIESGNADDIVAAIEAEGYRVLERTETPYQKKGLFARFK